MSSSAPTLAPETARHGAAIVAAAYEDYRARLRALITAARTHFEARDWAASQRDSALRLDVYNAAVDRGLGSLHALLGPAMSERPTWAALRAAYEPLVASFADPELAETFFNSFTRRMFHTIGVDPGMEFVSPVAETRAPKPDGDPTVRFPAQAGLARALHDALAHFAFEAGYEDAAGDVERMATVIGAGLDGRAPGELQLARAVFYRGKGAYLVGLVHTRSGPMPLLVALTHPPGGIVVDAVLTTTDEVSIVFSFARSYFFVDAEPARDLVVFLRAIMPRKARAELYNALGFDKHGKSELYRSLLRHLDTSDDRFVVARGQRGMVMAVFTLPGFDVVFKVIRDRFEYPKTVTHEEVRAKYRMVFRHDRAGRLVDAQEFEHLAFDRARFESGLLDELLTSCSERVALQGDQVVIAHLYTERRLRPLDLYLREAGDAAAREAVIDYGHVLRDLAATNVFPGDMLLKNFGVSRHGRLIFYDYDELCTLTDCRFRELPPFRDEYEEGAAEPSFYVGERDIFPEEFRGFLGLPIELLNVFLAHHRELLSVRFWHRMQQLHESGEVLDIYPYKSTRRLRPTPRRPRDADAAPSA